MKQFLDSESVITEPPCSQWPELISKNTELLNESGIISTEDRFKLRSAVYGAARKFRKQSGVSCELPEQLPSDAVWLVSGHQPVIYHPGILYKNYLLEQSCSAQTVILNVIIDTDSGDAGSYVFPKLDGDRAVGLEARTLTEGGELFLSQRFKSSEQLARDLDTISDRLRRAGFQSEALSVEKSKDIVVSAAGQPVAVMQCRIRQTLMPLPHLLELPLTNILSCPETVKFFGSIVRSAHQFALTFNSTLIRFREDRKIKNHANPFPNLSVGNGLIELPFWFVDRGRGMRVPAFLKDEKLLVGIGAGNTIQYPLAELDALLAGGAEGDIFIAPRAVMITAFLRLILSDLFIHGLGGGKYDAFLDLFSREYWKLSPPAFVVASATRRLFREQYAELQHREGLSTKKREITFHLSDYLDDPIFNAETREKLTLLGERREVFVTEIKRLQGEGNPSFQVNKELKLVDAAIKALLDQVIGSPTVMAADTRAMIESREYPFFFFLEH